MPSTVVSPHNGSAGLEVTLAEVLAARQSPLSDSDLWSVLFASCHSLDTRMQSDSTTWRNGPTLQITPDNTMLSHQGAISFNKGAQDRKKPGTFAPSEFLSPSRGQGRTAVEKMYIYSLGMTLYSAADFNVPDGQEMNLSEELETTLLNMCEDTADLRPSLADIMQACRGHCTDSYEQCIMSLVSVVLGSFTNSLDRVMKAGEEDQAGSFSEIPPYTAGRLPEGFISPERDSVFPAPAVAVSPPGRMQPPQHQPVQQPRRESGYASASLTNSNESSHLRSAVVAQQPVAGVAPVGQWKPAAKQLQAMTSTSSEDEAYTGRHPRQVRKDSLDVTRIHSAKSSHKKRSPKAQPRPHSKNYPEGGSRFSGSHVTQRSSMPDSSNSGVGNDQSLSSVYPSARQMGNGGHQQFSDPMIVPISPLFKVLPSPMQTSSTTIDGPVPEEVNASVSAVVSPAQPQELAGFSSQIAREALRRTESRDQAKFNAQLHSLEKNPGRGASHRVLDNILHYDPHGNEADANPVMRHALLNSMLGDENPTTSRDATGVFVGDTVQVRGMDHAPKATETIPEERPSSIVSVTSAVASSSAARTNGSVHSPRVLQTDEEEAEQRSMEHKDSLMMEKMYSVQTAKREAREAKKRDLSPVPSESTMPTSTSSSPEQRQQILSSKATTPSQSGAVEIAGKQSKPGSLALSRTVSPASGGSDDVFDDDRGFLPTSPKDFFQRERAESITKLKGFFGADFSKFDDGEKRRPSNLEERPLHVTIKRHDRVSVFNMDMPPQRRSVTVVLLDGKQLSVYVEIDSTGQEVFDQVASYQAINEVQYFGLTHRRQPEGEEVFLDLDLKLKKYAPKKWLSENQSGPLQQFTTYFRVKFFVNNLTLLKHSQTVQLYYLQLRETLKNGKIYCPEDRALHLASLALQAEIGDLRSDMARQKYFLPEAFLPHMAVQRLTNEELHNRLTALHTSHKGASHRQAQTKFVELARELQEYGIVFHRVRRSKHESPPSMSIGIYLGGVLLTMAMKHNERQKLHRFSWQGIDNLLFKKCRFTIVPRQRPNHQHLDNVTVWTDHYKMSKYLIALCKSFHDFSRKLRLKNGMVNPPRQSTRIISQVIPEDQESVTSPDTEGRFSSSYSPPAAPPNTLEDPTLFVAGSDEASPPDFETQRFMKRDESMSEMKLKGLSSIPLSQMEHYTVTLIKNPKYGLGLLIVGGTDTSHSGILVKKLTPNSAAYKCGEIQRGDRLLAVNGKSLDGLTHQEAINLLLESPPSCTLRMARVTSALIGPYLFQSDDALNFHISEESIQSPSPQVQLHSTPHPDRGPSGRDQDELLETSRIIASTPVAGAHVVQVNTDASTPGPMEGNKSVTSLLSGIADYGHGDLVQFTVHLTKDGGTLGIAITGGIDTPTQGGGVYIRSINPNGPTGKDGRLQIGDRILLVNKKSTVNITHKEAFEMLKNAPNDVYILVERAVLPASQRSSVVLPEPGKKYELVVIKSGQSLGFTIAKDSTVNGAPITVRAILPGETVAMTGMLSTGDYLLSVDNHSLEGCTLAEAVRVLRGTSGEVRLVLQRPELSGYLESPTTPLISYTDLHEPDGKPQSEQTDYVPSDRREDVFEVVVEKGDKRLGLIIFKDANHPSGLAPVVIRTVSPNQAAAATGKIQENDIIVQANGRSLEGISQAEATGILRSVPSTVKLLIKRIAPGTAQTEQRTTPHLPALAEDTVPEQAAVQHSQQEMRLSREGTPSPVKDVEPAPAVPSSEPPPLPDTERPEFSDFVSDTEDDEAGPSLNDSYVARAKWPPGEVIAVTVMKGEKGLGFLVQQEHGNCCFIRRIVEGPILDNGQLKPKDFLVEVNGVSLIDMTKADVTGVLKKVSNPITMTVVRPKASSVDYNSQDSIPTTPPAARRTDSPALVIIEPPSTSAAGAGGVQAVTPERLRRLSPVPPAHLVDRNSQSSPMTADSLSPLAKSMEQSTSSLSLATEVAIQYVPLPGQDEGAEKTTVILHIDLMKPPSGALGLRLSGGADKDDVPNGVYVRSVVEGTIAHSDGQLRVNDRVLEVNDQPLAGLRHARVVHLLRRASGRIQFKIARFRVNESSAMPSIKHVDDTVPDGVPAKTADLPAKQLDFVKLAAAPDPGTSATSTISALEEERDSSDDLETTAAESESEFSDFDSNPLLDDEDAPPLPDTPEMGANIRAVLKRLSTGGDEYDIRPEQIHSPLVDPSELMNPASLKLTFSPALAAGTAGMALTVPPQPADAGSTPSSPAPPLPEGSPPTTPETEEPSLPQSLPPDEDDPLSRPSVKDLSPNIIPVTSPTRIDDPLRRIDATKHSNAPGRYSGSHVLSGRTQPDAEERHRHSLPSPRLGRSSPSTQRRHQHNHHHHDHDHDDDTSHVDLTPMTAEEKLRALTSGKPTVRRVNKYCKSCSTPPSSPPLSRSNSDALLSPLASSSALVPSSSPSVVRRTTSASKTTPTAAQGGASPSLARRRAGPASSPSLKRKTTPLTHEQQAESAVHPNGQKSSEPILRTIAQELHSPAVSPASKRKAHERLTQNTFSTAAARAQKLHQDSQQTLSPPSPKTVRHPLHVPQLNLSPITRRSSSPRSSPMLHRQSFPATQPMGSPMLDRPSSWTNVAKTLPPGLIRVQGRAQLYTGDSLQEICREAMSKLNAGTPNQQFEELRNRPSPFSSNTGKNIRNKQRNRYRNIVAYDDTRVHLMEHDNDYINANYVAIDVGPSVQNNYICTQAPLPATLNHFWCMIWQQSVSTIVMTTNLVESGTLKCHQYWPKGMGEFLNVEWPEKSANQPGHERAARQLVVQLVDEKHCGDGNWMERKLLVSDVQTLESRTVTQLHYLTWPDHGVPKDSSAMVRFVCRTRDMHQTGRMIVHCSAGVGRSGAFCVVDSVISRVINDQEVDIYAILRQLRQCRPLMVQTKDQLVFCYRAFIEILISMMPESSE
ncbi:tyrosine-protein phosphatase non-receptor type 13-like [Sycon ciliatum]|uniref:tyrosine-protein phosphatase non-receptor type 13-like n=1 Tax=Sycon ciliatum TaxID=27933 RepID=UPI0031F6826C